METGQSTEIEGYVEDVIWIGPKGHPGSISIKLLKAQVDRAEIGINAPKSMSILRTELLERGQSKGSPRASPSGTRR